MAYSTLKVLCRWTLGGGGDSRLSYSLFAVVWRRCSLFLLKTEHLLIMLMSTLLWFFCPFIAPLLIMCLSFWPDADQLAVPGPNERELSRNQLS
jgi:hypothetical protein